jgi:hypothetical protein
MGLGCDQRIDEGHAAFLLGLLDQPFDPFLLGARGIGDGRRLLRPSDMRTHERRDAQCRETQRKSLHRDSPR